MKKDKVIDIFEDLKNKGILRSYTAKGDIVISGDYPRESTEWLPDVKISGKQMAYIVAIKHYAEHHPDFTQEDLNEMLKTKKIKFAILRKMNKKIPDFAEELKTGNIMEIVIDYARRVQEEDTFRFSSENEL